MQSGNKTSPRSRNCPQALPRRLQTTEDMCVFWRTPSNHACRGHGLTSLLFHRVGTDCLSLLLELRGHFVKTLPEEESKPHSSRSSLSPGLWIDWFVKLYPLNLLTNHNCNFGVMCVCSGPNFIALLHDIQIFVLTVAEKFAKVQAHFTG